MKITNYFLLALLLILINSVCWSQNRVFTDVYYPTNAGTAVVADSKVTPSGELISLITYQDSLLLTNESYVFSDNFGDDQGFCIVKYSLAGEIDWIKNFNGVLYGMLTIDQLGNIIVSGSVDGWIIDDEDTLGGNSAGYSDYFVMKLNQDGERLWSWRYGGDWYDELVNTCVDTENSIYLFVFSRGSFDVDPSSDSSIVSGFDFTLVTKYNSDGEFQWVKEFKTSDGGVVQSTCVVEKNNHFFIIGNFHGTVDFDPDSTNEAILSAGMGTAFFLELDQNGGYIQANKKTNFDFDDTKMQVTNGGIIYIRHTGRILRLNSDFSLNVICATADYPGVSLSDFMIDESNQLFVVGTFGPTTSLMVNGSLVQFNSLDGWQTGILLKHDLEGNILKVNVFDGYRSSLFGIRDMGSQKFSVSGRFEGTFCNDDSDGFSYYYDSTLLSQAAFLSVFEEENCPNDNCEFTIYPNPASDYINISFPSENGQISIYDCRGRLIKNFSALYGINSVDIGSFSSGMYFLLYNTSNVNDTRQFIKY